MKWSVIMPTIWQCEYIIPSLNGLSKCDFVDEIILIDNKPTEDIHIPKVQHIKEPENTFVNPAWNKGISMAKNDYIVLCNDDVLFDADEYFSIISHAKDIVDVGFIGSHIQNYDLEQSLDNIVIEPYDRHNWGGWGCLIAFNRNHYIPIPHDIKIYYGDNWMMRTNPNIFHIKGIKIKTKMSSSANTSVPWVKAITDMDRMHWHRL